MDGGKFRKESLKKNILLDDFGTVFVIYTVIAEGGLEKKRAKQQSTKQYFTRIMIDIEEPGTARFFFEVIGARLSACIH